VLAAAARGFGGLIANLLQLGDEAPKPAVRLLVNEQLDAEDVRALLVGEDAPKLTAKLLKGLKRPAELLERQRLAMVAWMVKEGLLEVRVGVMRHSGGVLHAKFGIITDAGGDAVTFMGSDNETAEALVSNYELVSVHPSWKDPHFADELHEEFERLWDNRQPTVLTVPLPEAVRLKLVKLAPEKPPTAEPRPSCNLEKAAMLWQFLAAAPYLAEGGGACDAMAPVTAWPHQTNVVEDASGVYPTGRLLCDEVGLGKTIEAILILRRLLAGRGVERALLLTPAGLMRQWQEELREKGGLIVPMWDRGYVTYPDGRREACDAARAMATCPVLLLSREWARLPANRDCVMQAPPWDLVLMDEAHAARRKERNENEFNRGNLLLELLRELQLSGQARGFLLLSATPMQLEAWEPWDLLSILGVGGLWLASFEPVRHFYSGLAMLGTRLSREIAQTMARLIVADEEFRSDKLRLDGVDRIAMQLWMVSKREAPALADDLRKNAPLGRHMHRNTRETLREYFRRGLLDTEPPTRRVTDEVYDHATEQERDVYDAVTRYIDARFEELEHERGGKGFVMTIYRRRAASSPLALRRSLERRRDAVERTARGKALDTTDLLDQRDDFRLDLDESGDETELDPGLPQSPEAAEREAEELHRLLEMVDGLGSLDSKRDRFMEVLNRVIEDGRSALVFSEYADTMEYVREELTSILGDKVASYSGDGGRRRRNGVWEGVSKADITKALDSGEIRVLVCTDAASEGLNLQAAGALINYDLHWNPSRIEQRIGRVDRIGQRQREVPIVNLFLKDSVDMAVYKALRKRCALFERFVGAMQPVLAEARKALRGQIRGVAEALRSMEEAAEEVAKDAPAVETYRVSPIVAEPAKPAIASRSDFERALAMLREDGYPVRARSARSGVLRITGLRPRAVETAMDPDALERHPRAEPTTSLDVVEAIAERLQRDCGPTPLVVAEWRSGRFRCKEVRWAAPQPKRVGSVAELARHLRLFGRQDLNGIWRDRMQNGGNTRRYRDAYEKLGGYCDWTPEELQDANRFVESLTSQREFHMSIAPTLDAALNDPRWKAAKTLAEMDER